MLQVWIVVAPFSKVYTVSIVLFHKDEEANVAVTNFMSHVSMFVSTNNTVKVANGNMGHAQGAGIILCCFSDCSVIFPLVKVYCCPGHSSKNILSGVLKFYVGFQNVASEPLEHCDFVDPQGCSLISPYQTQKNLACIQTEMFTLKPQRNRNIVVPNVYVLSGKIPISLFISSFFMSLLLY